MERATAIAHVDLDAFYAQVEAKLHPQLQGKPIVVVQYNPRAVLETLRPHDPRILPDSNGSIIAVSYEARACGVKRNMQAQQAKKLCPDLAIVQVPTAHGKADLTIYRDAGSKVAAILSRGSICERASIDEVYLDVTEVAARRVAALQGAPPPCPADVDRCHVCGLASTEGVAAWWQRPHEEWTPTDLLLACAAKVVSELRSEVMQHLGFSCSAGIAHYKVLAKLASGLHKPRQQTVVLAGAVGGLLAPLSISKLRQLGGKFGDELQACFGITTVGELAALQQSQLSSAYGQEVGTWLWRLARGMDSEEVKPRMLPKSLSCGKTFRGTSALHDHPSVFTWLLELGTELQERLEADQKLNARTARLLTVGLSVAGHKAPGPGAGRGRPSATSALAASSSGAGSVSRSCPLRRPTAQCIAEDAAALIKKWAMDRPGWKITELHISASNFTAPLTGTGSILRFLRTSSPASPGPGSPSSPPHPAASTSPTSHSSPRPLSPPPYRSSASPPHHHHGPPQSAPTTSIPELCHRVHALHPTPRHTFTPAISHTISPDLNDSSTTTHALHIPHVAPKPLPSSHPPPSPGPVPHQQPAQHPHATQAALPPTTPTTTCTPTPPQGLHSNHSAAAAPLGPSDPPKHADAADCHDGQSMSPVSLSGSQGMDLSLDWQLPSSHPNLSLDWQLQQEDAGPPDAPTDGAPPPPVPSPASAAPLPPCNVNLDRGSSNEQAVAPTAPAAAAAEQAAAPADGSAATPADASAAARAGNAPCAAPEQDASTSTAVEVEGGGEGEVVVLGGPSSSGRGRPFCPAAARQLHAGCARGGDLAPGAAAQQLHQAGCSGEEVLEAPPEQQLPAAGSSAAPALHPGEPVAPAECAAGAGAAGLGGPGWGTLEWSSVDPGVLSELPLVMQQEIRAELQGQQRAASRRPSGAKDGRRGAKRTGGSASASAPGKQPGIRAFFASSGAPAAAKRPKLDG